MARGKVGIREMLSFHSASVRNVNTERAVAECLRIAFPTGGPADCRAVLVNATMGHRLDRAAAAIRRQLPDVEVLGCTGCAVTGREGVGESLHDIALMAICGPAAECVHAAVEDIVAANAYEKALALARSLQAKQPDIDLVYLLCPGLDIDNVQVLRGFMEVFGEEVTVFGGTASDNMKAITSFQYHGDRLAEHDAWAVGFADKTLGHVTKSSHGFTAIGNPLTVTKAEGNRIFEFDGQPAWPAFLSRIDADPATDFNARLTFGALGEALPPALAEEYGNPHILRTILSHTDDVVRLPTTVEAGTRLWLVARDEELIFSEQEKALAFIRERMSGPPVAVFQTDCLARGRILLDKVVKDEIMQMMQDSLSTGGVVPPWLGNYGFGEYARLGGKNTYHNYTTSLLVLYRS